MLDSRYVHLHEALGLGVIWLKQSAKVIGQPETMSHDKAISALPIQTASSPTHRQPSKQPKEMIPSRLAVLQKINSRTLQPVEKSQPSTTAHSPDTTHTTKDDVSKLADSVASAKVMILSVCASPADVVAGQLFSGEDGILLHKMLNAINLKPQDVLISTWLKDLPDFHPKPSTEAVKAAAPRVQAECQLSGAIALLLMGDFFERPDVKAQLPNIKAFYIPHPQRILNNTRLKRSVWETLQQLEQFLQAA